MWLNFNLECDTSYPACYVVCFIHILIVEYEKNDNNIHIWVVWIIYYIPVPIFGAYWNGRMIPIFLDLLGTFINGSQHRKNVLGVISDSVQQILLCWEPLLMLPNNWKYFESPITLPYSLCLENSKLSRPPFSLYYPDISRLFNYAQ